MLLSNNSRKFKTRAHVGHDPDGRPFSLVARTLVDLMVKDIAASPNAKQPFAGRWVRNCPPRILWIHLVGLKVHLLHLLEQNSPAGDSLGIEMLSQVKITAHFAHITYALLRREWHMTQYDSIKPCSKHTTGMRLETFAWNQHISHNPGRVDRNLRGASFVHRLKLPTAA